MRRTSRLLTGALLLVTACAPSAAANSPAGTGNGVASSRLPDRPGGQTHALVTFDACQDFLDYVVSHAVDLVGPYGLPGSQIAWDGSMRAAEAAGDTTVASGESAAPDFSETNVQVEGVDEPDLAKSDGRRIVLISEGELVVVDVSSDEPEITGRLHLDVPVQNLFLVGDKVLLFGSGWNAIPLPVERGDVIAPTGAPTVQILEVDISGEPEIERTMTIDGSFVSGRMVEESVRLVLTSGPIGFEWSYPEGSGLRAEREAVERNREIVRESTEENWIPYYVITDTDGRVTSEGTLFECERAAHPEEFSGFDMLSVVTIDLGAGLEVVDSTGVLARGGTVYSSGDSLYVATQNWDTWMWLERGDPAERTDGPTTQIHKFDTSEETITQYVASGEVDGYLINQFAMDEHEEMLRVATTTAPAGWGSAPDSESRVTILRTIGDSLVPIGKVTGLGETEQIYSVRFMGDTGYVVTFRQTDPLYTLDLSDPRNPKMVGELKIPGYSAYLHPVSEGLLLGVGQDATDDGRVKGTQVSTFDVSDPASPSRIDAFTISEGSSSQVEYDHHAFLYHDALAVIPVVQWNWDGKTEDVFSGAVGLEVGEDGTLREVGEVVHPGGAELKGWDYQAQILRSFVVGDSLYTISASGIMKSTLDGLEQQSWLDL